MENLFPFKNILVALMYDFPRPGKQGQVDWLHILFISAACHHE